MMPLEGKGITTLCIAFKTRWTFRPALEKAYLYSMSISLTRFCWRMIST